MRLPEQMIRRAIQHPEQEVRLTALSYFTGAFDRDATIMSLAIKAVEKYGRENAFRTLRRDDLLSQTVVIGKKNPFAKDLST